MPWLFAAKAAVSESPMAPIMSISAGLTFLTCFGIDTDFSPHSHGIS